MIKRWLPLLFYVTGKKHDGIIFVQHDNAKSHINLDDPKFVEDARRDRFDIR